MNSLTWAVVLLAGLACAQGRGTPVQIQDRPSTGQVFNKVATVWLQQGIVNIITNFHAVGCATSFQDIRQNRLICLGSHVRGECETTREVALISNHQEYDPTTRFADISVIRFNATLLFGPTINFIQILPQNFVVQPNWPLSTYGYGTTTEGGVVSNNFLHRLDLETKTLASCQSAHAGRVVSDKLCVGLPAPATGRDFDSRDTGSPIIYEGVLFGLLNIGSIRQNDAVPILATSTGSHSNWIVENAR